MVRFSGLVLQSQSNGKRRDEVHIADVDEQLPAVEGELAESKVGVGIRVGRVEDRRLHEAWAGVQEELQTLARGEPDAATGNARDSRNDGVAGRAEMDRDIFGQVLTGQGWRRRVVRRFGIRRKAEQFALVVDGLAG